MSTDDDDDSDVPSPLPDATGPLGAGEYEVQPGDCIESLAFQNGFLPTTLWNLPENADLKKARKQQTALLPGDRVHIPEPRVKEESRAAKKRYRFKRKGVPSKLVLVLLDGEGKPRAGESYRLTIDGVTTEGKLDGSGRLEVAVSPIASEGQLMVGEADVYDLQLRQLAPSSEPTGVQARLQNLGYYSGEIDGEVAGETRIALACFQRDHNLDPSGQPNADTLKKLEDVHGG